MRTGTIENPSVTGGAGSSTFNGARQGYGPALPGALALPTPDAYRSPFADNGRYDWQDNVVVPQPTALLSAAVNVEVSGMGHLSMLFTERCQALLLREIRAARGELPGG